jgi:hypothetical protein
MEMRGVRGGDISGEVGGWLLNIELGILNSEDGDRGR